MTAPTERADATAADVDKLAGILAKHPDESVHITSVYPDCNGWWRVCVRVGLIAAFAPRYRVFDDAGSFRARARAML